MAKQKNKKLLNLASASFAAVLFALILLSWSGKLDFFGTKEGNSGPSSEEKSVEAKNDAEAKRKLIEESTDPAKSNPTNTGQVSTIELSAQLEADRTVTIFTKLPGVSAGTCSLKVSNGTVQRSYSANVIYQPEYSTCAGFSVPVSDLGPGSWTINLRVDSGRQVAERAINYEVK